MATPAGERSSGKRLLAIYNSLLGKYGPQGWWPTIQSNLITYHRGDYSFPKTEAQRFEICAGAILTQNTSWKNVEKALLSLHSSGNLSAEKIISLSLPKLEALIRSSGYFRQKAKRLKLLCRAYLDADVDTDTESLREHFLSVKGVGPETVDSILLYAFRRPVFVVDAYTQRFCSSFRLFHGHNYISYKEFFESCLPRSHSLFNEFHALIVKWGKSQKIMDLI